MKVMQVRGGALPVCQKISKVKGVAMQLALYCTFLTWTYGQKLSHNPSILPAGTLALSKRPVTLLCRGLCKHYLAFA